MRYQCHGTHRDIPSRTWVDSRCLVGRYSVTVYWNWALSLRHNRLGKWWRTSVSLCPPMQFVHLDKWSVSNPSTKQLQEGVSLGPKVSNPNLKTAIGLLRVCNGNSSSASMMQPPTWR